MKEHLINTHLLVPRSRSSAKVKVKYKGYISQKKWPFRGHSGFTNTSCFKLKFCMMHISHTILAGVMKFQHKYTAVSFNQWQKFLYYYFSIPPLYDHYAPTLQIGLRWAYFSTICFLILDTICVVLRINNWF